MNSDKTGKLIANARKEKNMTQQELADIIGIGSKAISKWERGLTFPDISILKILSETLEVTIEELIIGEKKKNKIKSIKTESKFLKYIVTIFFIILILTLILISILINNSKNSKYTYSITGTYGNLYLEGNIKFNKKHISIIIDNLKFENTETIVESYNK